MVWCSNPHPLEATSVPPAVAKVTQLLPQPLFAVDLLQVVTVGLFPVVRADSRVTMD